MEETRNNLGYTYQEYEDQIGGIFARLTGLPLLSLFDSNSFRGYFDRNYIPINALYEASHNLSDGQRHRILASVPGAKLPDLFSVTYDGPTFASRRF